MRFVRLLINIMILKINSRSSIFLLCILISGSLAQSCSSIVEKPITRLELADKIQFQHKEPAIIIYTNRTKSASDSEYKFFGNEIDLRRTVYSMKVHCENSECKLEICGTHEDAFDHLELSHDVLVFIHGDGKSFNQTIERCIQIKELYNVNVIAFDWPSKDPTKLNGATNYYNSRNNVRLSVKQFGEFLKHTNDYFKKKKSEQISVNILFHSLGALLLQRYIEYGEPELIEKPVFNNLILDAAAVKQNEHAVWLNRVNFQKKLYVIMNDNDFTLHGASILTFGKMLGISTDGPLSDNADYIDYSQILEFEHNYCVMDAESLGSEIRGVYDKLFHGYTLDLNDTGLFKKKSDIRIYDVIKK